MPVQALRQKLFACPNPGITYTGPVPSPSDAAGLSGTQVAEARRGAIIMDADLAVKLQRRRALIENTPADAPATASAATQMKAEPRPDVGTQSTPRSTAIPSSAETNPGSRRLPEKSNKPLQGQLWSPEKAVVDKSRPGPRWSPVKSGDSALGKVAHCEGSEACSRPTHSTKLPAAHDPVR